MCEHYILKGFSIVVALIAFEVDIYGSNIIPMLWSRQF